MAAEELPFKQPVVIPEGEELPEFQGFDRPDLQPEVNYEELHDFLVETGQKFHDAGYIPVPVLGKRPILGEWQKITYEQSMDLLRRNKKYDNLGVLTGKNGNLTVIDIDQGGEENFRNILESLSMDWPDTYEVETGGGGIHLYFQYAGSKLKSAPLRQNKRRFNIDLRNTGGVIVAPGSLHPTTHRLYRVKNPKEPQFMPRKLIDALAEYQT